MHRSASLASSRAPMTGLRAIEQTIPSTLHTLLRPLRRTHFQEALRRSSGCAVKFIQSMTHVRIRAVRVTAISLGTTVRTRDFSHFLFLRHY